MSSDDGGRKWNDNVAWMSLRMWPGLRKRTSSAAVKYLIDLKNAVQDRSVDDIVPGETDASVRWGNEREPYRIGLVGWRGHQGKEEPPDIETMIP